MDRAGATVRLVDGIFGMYNWRALQNSVPGLDELLKIIGWGEGVSAVTQFGARFGV
jgi:hypothetical protein